jgi:hypothetical protein
MLGLCGFRSDGGCVHNDNVIRFVATATLGSRSAFPSAQILGALHCSPFIVGRAGTDSLELWAKTETVDDHRSHD